MDTKTGRTVDAAKRVAARADKRYHDHLRALTRLSIMRQANLQERDFMVFIEELSDVDPDVLAESCQRLGREPRERYETAFPDVGAIRAACAWTAHQRDMARVRALAQSAPRALIAPPSGLPRTLDRFRRAVDKLRGR